MPGILSFLSLDILYPAGRTDPLAIQRGRCYGPRDSSWLQPHGSQVFSAAVPGKPPCWLRMAARLFYDKETSQETDTFHGKAHFNVQPRDLIRDSFQITNTEKLWNNMSYFPHQNKFGENSGFYLVSQILGVMGSALSPVLGGGCVVGAAAGALVPSHVCSCHREWRTHFPGLCCCSRTEMRWCWLQSIHQAFWQDLNTTPMSVCFVLVSVLVWYGYFLPCFSLKFFFFLILYNLKFIDYKILNSPNLL